MSRHTLFALISGIAAGGGMLIWIRGTSANPTWFILATALFGGVTAGVIVAFNRWTWERIGAAILIRDGHRYRLPGVRSIALCLALGYATWCALRGASSLSAVSMLQAGVVARFLVVFIAVLPITGWIAFVAFVSATSDRTTT